MRDLFLLASEVQSFCQVRGWRFCFIGGIALQRWGEPRLTADIDLTILTGFGHEAQYIEELCSVLPGAFPTLPTSLARAGPCCFSRSGASPSTSRLVRYPSRSG